MSILTRSPENFFQESSSHAGFIVPVNSNNLLAPRVAANDGTVGSPSIVFIDDQDTGLHRIGANNFSLDAGGASILQVKNATPFLTSTLTVIASSGTEVILDLNPTINQSGTAGYTVLKVGSTESATGSGNKRLLEVGVNSFIISKNGNVQLLGDVTTDIDSDTVTRFGVLALANNDVGGGGVDNGAFGKNTLSSNTTGSANMAVGLSSLFSNTTGSNNIAVGRSALFSNTTGNNNSAVGRSSLQSNTGGSNNIAFGQSALRSNTTGNNNSAFGFQAGRFIADGATANETGLESIFLGADTKANADGQTNQIVIGYNAVGRGSNSVVMGNDNIAETRLKGNVGIGAIPNAKLHVDQTSATGAIPVLLLDQADDSEEMIEFTGTVGVGNAIEAVGSKTLTTTHFIKVTITGVGQRYIPVGTIA